MKHLYTISWLLVSWCASAQGIKGIVLNSDKKPLEGATILNLANGAHTHSNERGLFLLKEASPGDSIKITRVSFAPRILRIEQDSFVVVLTPAPFQLETVTIRQSITNLNILSEIDLQTNPVSSSQELLRMVPGLFMGQHAGGGKAEQIFLRGFDIDHGTDINLTVDGMPVNMVSHAHGQGYADLHFLIPETVDKIDFDKGPYHAGKGNLATAGYVAFNTKERLNESRVQFEAGKFGTYRTLGLFNLVNNEKQAAYLAADYLMTDGYFEAPQNFNRINLLGKYTAYLPNHDKLSVSLSHFCSKWDASGQIPQRAVDEGLITRFGAIDATEGGKTSRTNVNVQFLKQLDASTTIANTAYFSRYDFELYSNFTFFLEDPVNGDQIRQKEKRNIIGFNSELNRNLYLGQHSLGVQAAIGFRNDDVNDIELSHTLNRKITLNRIQLGDINETNLFGYVGGELKMGKWLINPALRVDHFKFNYNDQLATTYQTQAVEKSILSPKLNFLYNASNKLQYFLKLGKGFHSNDTRVVVAQNGLRTLPAAYGADLGAIWKPIPELVLNTAFWYLFLQQEFIYVGDAGIVEPGGKTTRMGIDVGARYQLGRYVFLQGDFTYTHARADEAAKGDDYLPLAPRITAAGGLSLKHPSGWNAGVHTRYLGHRPANEDNSIVAKGYCITDANISYQYKWLTIGIVTENIFNVKWNETQFATESRLKEEPAPVTEIHFTPGTPFNIRGVISCRF